MQVIISGMVWLPRGELNNYQINNIKQDLTIQPRKTTDIQTKENPAPIFLFEEDEERGMIGVPRHYYLEKKTSDHEEVLDVSYGRPMRDLQTNFKADGPYAEQLDALDELTLALEGRKWGGVLLRGAPGFGKTIASLEFARRIGRKTLILVHKDFLVRQWKKRLLWLMPDARVGIIKQKVCEFDELQSNGEAPDFVIALLQSLSRDDGFKYPDQLYSAFGTIISDESLPCDSMILTEDGPRKIGELVAEDRPLRVVAYDRGSKQFSLKRVTRRWAHPPKCRMVEVVHECGSFRCTENHVIVTPLGDVRAKDLAVGVDSVVCYRHGDSKRNVQKKDGVDRRIDDGRRLSFEVAKECEGAFSCIAGSRAARTCAGEVRCAARVGEDATEGSAKYGVGEDALCVLNSWQGGPGACTPCVLSRGAEEAEHGIAGGVLVTSAPGVVADGRRQSCGASPSPTHGRVRSGRCRAAGGMVDGSWAGSACESDEEVLAGCIFEPGIAGRGSDGPFVHDSILGIQDRTSSALTEADNLRGLWGEDSARRVGASQEKILPFGILPDGEAGRVVRVLGERSCENCGDVSREGMSSLRGVSSIECREGSESEDMRFSVLSEGAGYSEIADAVLRDSEGELAGDPFASRILSVVPVATPDLVYDLSVEGLHNFIADGVVVHNCHRVGAGTWAGIMPRFNAAWRLGVTATPRRKDGAQDVFFRHISPITYSAHTQMMRPKLRRVFTDSVLKPISRGKYQVSVSNLNSGQVINQLAADKFRTRHIVDDMVKGVVAGRKLIVVSERLGHLKAMAEQLGAILFGMDLPFVPRLDFYTGDWFSGEKWEATKRGRKGKILHRKGDPKFKKRSDADLEKAESANVIFATKQMVEEALDIPPIDVLVMATPLGDVEQLVGRSQRWCFPEEKKCKTLCPWRAGKCKKKSQPIIVDVVDENIDQLRPKYNRRLRFYKKVGAI